MPLKPITVSRLKTVVLLGHSNGDGWGATSKLFEDYPHLSCKTLIPAVDPANAYWDGVYVATSPLPYPGTEGTPTAANVGDVAWLEMTIANTAEPTDPHPHPEPYKFPNVAGACYPQYYYNSWPLASYAGFHITPAENYFTGAPGQASPNEPGSLTWIDPDDARAPTWGSRHGLEIPLMWQWKNLWQEQVGLVKMSFSSSLFMPLEVGAEPSAWLNTNLLGPAASTYSPTDPLYVRSAINTSEYPWHAWWTPGDQFDWSPLTKRFYQKWYDKMVGSAAALPAGTKMDVQMVIPWFGDNDSAARLRSVIEEDFGRAWRAVIKRMRADLVANDWTTLSEDEIPIIIPKVHFGYPGPGPSTDQLQNPALCNAILAEIAAEDEYVKIANSWAWTLLFTSGYESIGIIGGGLNHFSHKGYVEASAEIMELWESCQKDPYDALRKDDTITVAQAIDRVRLYYSKSRSNTDQTREIILQHLNSAVNHIANHVGDNAWWWRRRKQFYIASSPIEVHTLPSYVNRLLIIEDPQDPTYPIMFTQIGHGDGGRLQIQMDEHRSGTFWCSFITHPRELTADEQIIPAPKNVTEWIIVETCRRLAAASSNAALMGHFGGESMQLQSDCMRNMGAVQRTKRIAMRTQRRRPNFGYGKGQRWVRD